MKNVLIILLSTVLVMLAGCGATNMTKIHNHFESYSGGFANLSEGISKTKYKKVTQTPSFLFYKLRTWMG